MSRAPWLGRVGGLPALLGGLLLAGSGLLPPAAQAAVPVAEAGAPVPLTIDGGPTSAADPTPVRLSADLYLPPTTPAPAVVIAHGFGGDKTDVAPQATQLADAGFVVLAYTARGFGESTGRISMNAPRYEVADARAVVSELAGTPQVLTDAPGDPRVGVTGGSYGGALALLLAGSDDRIDAVAADITWNDLQTSLFGQSRVPGGELGVFKSWWAGSFFTVGLEQPGARATPCGRFARNWCRAFDRAATRGVLTRADARLMAASSPRSVTGRITAATLIGAGQADSLFPFAQAVATYEQITAAHPRTPVKLVWHGGGHDGGAPEGERLADLMTAWMTAHLAGGPPVDTDFEVTFTDGALGADSRREPVVATMPAFPGLAGGDPTPIDLTGTATAVRAPAGGAPAAVSSFPGAGALAGLATMSPPGQSAAFDSAPVTTDTTLVGSPRVTLQLSSTREVRDVALFAQLRVVTATGTEIAPQGLVAPVRLNRLGPAPTTATVDLPAIATRVSVGDRLRVVVTTTDAAYQLPVQPAVYSVDLADRRLLLPATPGIENAQQPISPWLLLAVPLMLGVVLLAWLLRPRAPRPTQRPELSEVPVVIEGLSKSYRRGPTAVDDITFQVPPGVVLGLLGPNGAGKTTTMRMLMGLIEPSAGAIYLFGSRVHPGAEVLSRCGSLIEGAGFLPHLSGRTNLELYWRATGRSSDPRMAQVLDIAGLGGAADRKVRSYSQGMRQRLGIAQAMLGMPDLLVLDEPTNGLDPPQIREMRDVLRDYAAAGRTVVVSSHLLAEVEMTCTHVIVMNRGRVVAEGEVADLRAGGERLEDVFLGIVGNEHTVGEGR